MLSGENKEVLFPLIVSIYEKGYLFFLVVFGLFVGFYFFFFLTARPPEQHSIWEFFPKCVDTIRCFLPVSTAAVLGKERDLVVIQ